MKNEKSKHTPGPWEVNDIYPADVYGFEAGTKRGRCISTCINVRAGNVCYTAEDRANARLISAAPELLAALELALIAIDEEAAPKVAGMARAAIAKARGN